MRGMADLTQVQQSTTRSGDSTHSSEEGLRKLNKDLLTRNAELVQIMNRLKSERDNFEQLFTEWKKINKDASEALNLLQKEKNKHEEENILLYKQIREYKLQINSLKLLNNERSEQCEHLLLRCNQYQNDIRELKEQINANTNNANINTLKFNYQQKKNEIDQILYQITKLFTFCHANYPQITSNVSPFSNYRHLLEDVLEDANENAPNNLNHTTNEEEHFKRKKHKKNRDFTVRKKKKHRSTHSLSDFDKEIFRKRRSLNYIYDHKQSKAKETKPKHEEHKQRILINNDAHYNSKEMKKSTQRKMKVINNIDQKITPELLGPKTSYHQYDTKRSDPFGRTQSSHSFFSEQSQQRLRYNKVTLNMSGSSKLWSKRDSLSKKKKKQPRINAIPSSAGSTPLTTPQQSRRGRMSDDDEDDEDAIYFVEDDPHQKYLEMMGGDNNAVKAKIPQVKTKISDKNAIHDLFDMLQHQTAAVEPQINHNISNSSNSSNELEFYDEVQDVDAQLVPLPEPSDSDSDSDSSSDLDSSSD